MRRTTKIDALLDFTPNSAIETYIYVPTVICIVTRSNYTDIFRKILQIIYLRLYKPPKTDENILMISLEFMKIALFFAMEPVIPPNDVEVSLEIGEYEVTIPAEKSSDLPHEESSILILMQLVDISNIIKCWEGIILNKHIIVVSANDYLLFVILDAFKQLLFPLSWTLSLIPVLNPKLVEYLGSIIPIMIGINSTKFGKEITIANDKDDIILNLDFGTLRLGNTSADTPLCSCQYRKIYDKLLLCKTYYNISQDRIADFNLEIMEGCIRDKAYCEEARKLNKIHNQQERESFFINLIRKAFFSFFSCFANIKEFMEAETPTGDEEVFHSENFLNKVPICGPECKMPYFWQSLINNTMSFQQFIDYYKKLDNSYLKTFTRMHKYKTKPECKKVRFRPILGIKEILEGLKKNAEEMGRFGSLRKYSMKTFQLLREEIEAFMIVDNRKEEQNLRKNISEDYANLLLCFEDNANIFYGKSGLIRTNMILMTALNKDGYRKYLSQIPFKIVNESWEYLLIGILHSLTYEPWDLEFLMEALIELNKANSFHIPKYYAALIIKELSVKDPEILDKLCMLDGKLKKLAMNLKKSSGIPRSISISSRKPTRYNIDQGY